MDRAKAELCAGLGCLIVLGTVADPIFDDFNVGSAELSANRHFSSFGHGSFDFVDDVTAFHISRLDVLFARARLCIDDGFVNAFCVVTHCESAGA